MKIQFNKIYFVWATILFMIEVGIALFFHDEWIRPLFGDFLVVIFLYCLLRSFIEIDLKVAIGAVLLFSYLIEFFQYLNYVEVLGLSHNRLAATVMGTYFSWADIWMYTFGLVLVFIIEKLLKKRKTLHG